VSAPISSAPIVAVLKWQAIIALVCACVAYVWVGPHGAISAVLGAVVNASSIVVYWFVANMGLSKTRATGKGTGLWPLLRAEIAKLVMVVVQIALLFNMYAQFHVPSFFVVFILTLLAWRVSFAAQAKLEKQT
jgi:ATP synthase protein I